VQLLGKTLGIIGMGRIGQAMARRAVGFGMTVIYAGGAHGEHRRVELDELFRDADVISLHCPLTPETRHIVNARTLALVKPSAIIVNTARGECLDEAALLEALAARRIFGAGLDVFEGEPRVDARLRADPRLVLAPHIGSATTEARSSMAQLCADGVIAVLSGTRPPNLVNREVVVRG
jgi:lactate dehydrogenase-like 2-hydroxyacid dehydrogenase